MMEIDEMEDEVGEVVVKMADLAFDEQQSSDTEGEAEKEAEASITKGKLLFIVVQAPWARWTIV